MTRTRTITLKDHVYNYISEQISVGKLSPNERINESDICEVLNISRTPVREALIQLSSDGYLESIPGKGLRVKKMDEQRAKDLYEIIGLIEGYIASNVINELSENDLKEMEIIANNLGFYIDSKQYKKYQQLQDSFHEVYIKKYKNIEMINTLNDIKKNFMRGNLTYLQEKSEHWILSITNKQHYKIIDLFKEGDSNKLYNFIKDIHWSTSATRYDL